MNLGNFAAAFQQKRDELVQKYGPDFEKPSVSFGLNVAEAAVVAAWVGTLRAEIMGTQKSRFKDHGIDDIIDSEPYYGATGGGLTYSFIPTSLGTIITVKETITGKELNVSDALGWYFYG
jgi:hypothetical protein